MGSMYNPDIAVWFEDKVITNCSSCFYPMRSRYAIRIGAVANDRDLCSTCLYELYEQLKQTIFEEEE